MTAMEFILVAHAIIVGLGVAEILRGFADYLRAEKGPTSVRLLLIAAWSLLLLMQVWWTIWNIRQRAYWTFAEFLLFLLPLVVMYLLARLSFPEGQLTMDLHDYYRRMAPKLWLLVALAYLSFMPIQPILYGRFVPAILASQAIVAIAALIATNYRARLFHYLVIAAMFAQVAWRGWPQVIHG